MKRNISQPVGFDGKELQGYFMISNKDAATTILNKLTGSQLRLWLYLMMIDSFADFTSDGEIIFHSLPSPAEIAVKLGVVPDTVEKDMRKLKKLGLYDYRITSWQGHNSTSNHAKQEALKLKQKKSQTPSEQNQDLNKPQQSLNNPSPESKTTQTQSGESEGLNNPQEGLNNPQEGLNNPQEGLNNPQEGLNNPQKLPKPSSGKDSKPPQTIQTYSNFIKTLSEGEREKFFNFVRKQIKNFPKPINDLQAWLATPNKAGENRWEVYYQNFVNEQTPKTQHRPLREQIEERRQKMIEQRRQKLIEEGKQNTSDTITDNNLNGGQTQ